MGKQQRQIEDVIIKVRETEEAVERRVGPLERAGLGLAETKDQTTRIEFDVAGLRAAMADDTRNVGEVQREVTGLKAELWDCCPKVKKDLAILRLFSSMNFLVCFKVYGLRLSASTASPRFGHTGHALRISERTSSQ
jgi:hypothetical protein